MMILTEELFSLRMGRETWTRPQEDMWTGPRIHVDKTPERHVTQISGDQGDKELDTHSHSPGRQQPVNQEDRLWHKKRGGGVKKRTVTVTTMVVGWVGRKASGIKKHQKPQPRT